MKPFFYLGLIYITLFCNSHTEGTNYWGNCCGWNWCDEFEAGVDFLWWKPCIQHNEFCGVREEEIITGCIKIDFDFKGLCPDWSPGVRVWLDYPDLLCWCHLGFRASYTYIEVDDDSREDEGEVLFLLLHPGLFSGSQQNMICTGSYEACYHEWNAVLYFDCCCNSCHSIRPYFGLAGLFVDQDLESSIDFYQSTSRMYGNTDWESEIWGIGLRLGLEYRYCYSGCLSFFTLGEGTLLAGRMFASNKQVFEEDELETHLDIKEDGCCTCVPGYHIGTGVEYNVCICGCNVCARLGYEFLIWHGLPRHRIYSGDDVENEIGISHPGERTFGFQGLFAGLGMRF